MIVNPWGSPSKFHGDSDILREIQTLHTIYIRDLEKKELSDDAISAVNTSIRSLAGALDKIASELHRQLGTRNPKPYFPIAKNPADFPNLLQSNLPGLTGSHPKVAEAIERQQPYQLNQAPLAHLRDLYRENHHQDFSLQVPREGRMLDLRVDGRIVLAVDTRGLTLGGAPPWRGIPTEPEQAFIDIAEDALPEGTGPIMFAMTTHADGAVDVYANGKLVVQREAPPNKTAGSTWIDWHFAGTGVSVMGTLVPLHDLCVKACEEVWSSTGL